METSEGKAARKLSEFYEVWEPEEPVFVTYFKKHWDSKVRPNKERRFSYPAVYSGYKPVGRSSSFKRISACFFALIWP